jgi:hypothetical protein
MTVKGPRSGAATLKVIETGPKTFPHQADHAISKSVPRRVTQNNEGVRCAAEGFIQRSTRGKCSRIGPEEGTEDDGKARRKMKAGNAPQSRLWRLSSLINFLANRGSGNRTKVSAGKEVFV